MIPGGIVCVKSGGWLRGGQSLHPFGGVELPSRGSGETRRAAGSSGGWFISFQFAWAR